MTQTLEKPVEQKTEEKTSCSVQKLLEIGVPVIVKLAEKKMNVEGIAGISVGAIIEFDKEADQELELMIRDKTIGFGKAVKIGEKFGLRVTSVIDVKETINALGRSKYTGGLVDPSEIANVNEEGEEVAASPGGKQ